MWYCRWMWKWRPFCCSLSINAIGISGEAEQSVIRYLLRSLELTILQAVAAALRMLCSDLLLELEKPLSSSSFSTGLPEVRFPSLRGKNLTEIGSRNDVKWSRKSIMRSWLLLFSFCMRFRRDRCFGIGVRKVRFLMLWFGCRDFGLVGMRSVLSFLTSAAISHATASCCL